MELFATEMTNSKKLSVLQTEVNLLNKLLFFEIKFSDHLINELFVLYDQNLFNIQQNYRYFDAWNQLEKQKSIAKQNAKLVKKLRKELKNWRQNHNRLNNDILRSDHTYSSRSDVFTSVKDKSLKTDSQSTGSQSGICCETQTSTIVPKVKTEINSAFVPIKLEVIPKPEPEDCLVCEETINASEETDSASERDDNSDCLIEGVEPITTGAEASQPFLFLSEYLSKNKAFSHLLDKSKEQSTEDKTIAIDLNSDSDAETTSGVNPTSVSQPVPKTNSFLNNCIVDLTPKAQTPKKSPKKSFIKKRVRFGRKKTKFLRSSAQKSWQNESNSTSNPSISDSVDNALNQRVINSNRKKIHFNPDNTISIFEVRGSPIKGSSLKGSPVKKKDTQVSSPAISSMSKLSRNQKARDNENLIKNNKKIDCKGGVYYCRHKGCSYRTNSRFCIIRHTWKHTGEKPFKCQHCTLGFRDTRLLSRHMLTHTGPRNGVYKTRGSGSEVCPVCYGTYVHFAHLMRHMRQIHGKDKAQEYRNSCKFINNPIDSRDVDKQKSPSSTRTSIEKLPRTQLVSKTRNELNLKPISPKKAKKTIENPSEDKPEVTEGEADDSKDWKCDFKACLRSYSSKCNLKRHQMEIHKKLSKSLFYGNIKSKDVKYFIPKTPKLVGNSPKKTKIRKTLEISKTTVPQTEGAANKGFSCNYKDCKNSYFTISGLYKHKKNIHMFKTEWSSAAQKATNRLFQNSTSAQHLPEDKSSGPSVRASKKNKTPSVERKYTCPEADCGSRFVWAKNLKTHLREKHNNSTITGVVPDLPFDESNDEKSFQCSYPNCSHMTASRKSQVIHYKTHFSSEDKPFKCLITGCDYSSQKLSLLKYHVLNRHSEQQFFRAMEETGVQYPSWY